MRLSICIATLTALVLAAGCDRGPKSTSVEQDQKATQLPATGRDTNLSSGSNSIDDKEANNTSKNVRDRSGETLTPGDQGNNEADIGITRQIRQSINSNEQLSSLAENIKIITVNGKVTLRGPVHSEQEKQAIETAARQSGASFVDNQLEIKANNQ